MGKIWAVYIAAAFLPMIQHAYGWDAWLAMAVALTGVFLQVRGQSHE